MKMSCKIIVQDLAAAKHVFGTSLKDLNDAEGVPLCFGTDDVNAALTDWSSDGKMVTFETHGNSFTCNEDTTLAECVISQSVEGVKNDTEASLGSIWHDIGNDINKAAKFLCGPDGKWCYDGGDQKCTYVDHNGIKKVSCLPNPTD